MSPFVLVVKFLIESTDIIISFPSLTSLPSSSFISSLGLTVIGIVAYTAVLLSSCAQRVAVNVVLPSLTPCTIPFSSTVAIDVSAISHLIVLFLKSAGYTVAVMSLISSPASTVSVPFKSILAT